MTSRHGSSVGDNEGLFRLDKCLRGCLEPCEDMLQFEENPPACNSGLFRHATVPTHRDLSQSLAVIVSQTVLPTAITPRTVKYDSLMIKGLLFVGKGCQAHNLSIQHPGRQTPGGSAPTARRESRGGVLSGAFFLDFVVHGHSH